jgi:uncharacterized membrane protein YccF (DUF307 family)
VAESVLLCASDDSPETAALDVAHSPPEATDMDTRLAWFVLVGWWASFVAMVIGYVLVVSILGLPFGLLIYNRVPFVATLFRY